MPKKIDPEVRARAVRLVADHLGEYPSLTAASAAVAKQVGVGHETVRRWVLQSQVDGGLRGGATTDMSAWLRLGRGMSSFSAFRTQFSSVVSANPRSLATCAIWAPFSRASATASSVNSRG